MEKVGDIAALEAVYGTPGEASVVKVRDRLTPTHRAWIGRSRFCILSTVGPEGVDGSPRGDDRPVVRVVDERTLALPDWRGDNRMDSLRNIVRDGRVALMFLVSGFSNVVRVNGMAFVTLDEDLRGRYARGGKAPRSVVVIRIAEVYSQCARALMRAEIWNGEDLSAGLPTVGDMLREATAARTDPIDGDAYDAEWPGRAAKTL